MLMLQKEQERPAGYKRSHDLVIFFKSIGGFRNSQDLKYYTLAELDLQVG